MKASKIVFLIFLMVSLCLVNTQPVKPQSSGTIYIRADGTVEGTDKIQRDGNVYTFLGNISIDGSGIDGIIVERDNIAIDGADYALQLTGATGSSIGIRLTDRNNVTIKNLCILNFNFGIYLLRSSNTTILRNYMNAIRLGGAHNNSIIENYLSHIMINDAYADGFSSGNLFLGNNITNGNVGINSLGGSANIISGNNITDCKIWGIFLENYQDNSIVGNNFENNTVGIFFSHGASNNTIYHNNFINNQKDMDDAHSVLPWLYEISINSWDNGVEGNYWSNYNGTDNDGDGIGDSPHFVYENNQDNYPLMNPVIITEFTNDEEPTTPDPTQMLVVAAVAIVLAIIVSLAFYRRKKRVIQ